MNNIITTISLFLIVCFSGRPDEPTDRLGVKGPLNFNDTQFKLSWSSHPNDDYYIQEYLPAGEKIESFNQMLVLHVLKTQLDAKDVLAQKLKDLTERKKTDAVCNYDVNESPDGKEFIVDFLLSESKDNKITIAEFNVYHYKQIELKGTKVVVAYAYSKRSYGNEIGLFLKNLGAERAAYLNKMIASPIPTIKLN